MITPDKTWMEPAIGQKIYKSKTIQIAVFVGGPLVAGYLIAENYKAFDEQSKAKTALLVGIIATLVIVVTVFLIPDSVKIPRIIIPLVYSWLVYFVVEKIQGEQIKAHFTAGGESFSIWRALLISLIGAIVTLAVVFIVLFFIPVPA